MTSRTARRLGAGALLGLPAALLAHLLVFGQAHAAGGSMHGVLLEAAVAFAFFAALSVAIAASASVRGISPRFAPILAGAGVWFAGIEVYEHEHGVPVLFCALALIFSAWLIRTVLRAFAHTVVAIVVALWTPLESSAAPHLAAITFLTPPQMRPAYRFRVFSRPPPALS